MNCNIDTNHHKGGNKISETLPRYTYLKIDINKRYSKIRRISIFQGNMWKYTNSPNCTRWIYILTHSMWFKWNTTIKAGASLAAHYISAKVCYCLYKYAKHNEILSARTHTQHYLIVYRIRITGIWISVITRVVWITLETESGWCSKPE